MIHNLYLRNDNFNIVICFDENLTNILGIFSSSLLLISSAKNNKNSEIKFLKDSIAKKKLTICFLKRVSINSRSPVYKSILSEPKNKYILV